MDYNNLLEDEVEIIEIFNYELKEHGYQGYCSFYEEVVNGYFIYKDHDKWIYHFNKKGEVIVEKRYTNIYNLCLDILETLKIDAFYFNKMDLRIPRGTKVIITKDEDCLIDELNVGEIVGSNVVPYSSFENRRIYQVLGEDGNIYQGLYGYKMYGDICFRTLEDYIKDTKEQIEENRDTIKELHETNWDLFLMLTDAEDARKKYLLGDNKRKK